MEKIESKNAKIVGVMLGYEDHGILTLNLQLDYGGSQQGFGGFSLDAYDAVLKKRVPHVACGLWVQRVLETVGEDDLFRLKGKFVRVRSSHERVESIGHITDDKWFNPREELKVFGWEEA